MARWPVVAVRLAVAACCMASLQGVAQAQAMGPVLEAPSLPGDMPPQRTPLDRPVCVVTDASGARQLVLMPPTPIGTRTNTPSRQAQACPSWLAQSLRPPASAPGPETCVVILPDGNRMLRQLDPGSALPAGDGSGGPPLCPAGQAAPSARNGSASLPPGARAEVRVVDGKRVQVLRVPGDGLDASGTPAQATSPAPVVRLLPNGQQMLVQPTPGAPAP